MKHKFFIGSFHRENGTTFSGIPFIPENYQWNEPKSRVPFTSEPEFFGKWKTLIVSRVCYSTSNSRPRSHYAAEKFKNAAITRHLDLCLRKKIVRLSWRQRFRKAPFSKCFPPTLKCKAGVFKFLQLQVRFLR